jgi:hypothetical protein
MNFKHIDLKHPFLEQDDTYYVPCKIALSWIKNTSQGRGISTSLQALPSTNLEIWLTSEVRELYFDEESGSAHLNSKRDEEQFLLKILSLPIEMIHMILEYHVVAPALSHLKIALCCEFRS